MSVLDYVINNGSAARSYNETIDDENRFWTVLVYSAFTAIGIFLNASVFLFIMIKKMWHNFVSSHFIAHLTFTNLAALLVLVPIFIYNVQTGDNLWHNSTLLCRLQAFATCAVWSVLHYMTTCIAGVHLLTFARIHYDQLFGLQPCIICAVSWIIGATLGLPCLTNGDIVVFEPNFHSCVWGVTISGYKFLTYLVLLGVFLPSMLTWYAYVRVLGILFHSPIVFEALGLYKSRYLVYCFIISPLYQVPFFCARVIPSLNHAFYEWSLFAAYIQCIISPILYGVSLFLMKEEDMAVQARAHKGGAYHPPSVLPQQL